MITFCTITFGAPDGRRRGSRQLGETLMPLTGRFGFRKSLFGRIFLQVEEDAPQPWPLSLSGRYRRRWRDARYLDLVQPEIRGLINLRDYAQECPHGNLAAPVFAHNRRAALERPDAKAPPPAGRDSERPEARGSTLHGTVL
jgi:hypothetical protein